MGYNYIWFNTIFQPYINLTKADDVINVRLDASICKTIMSIFFTQQDMRTAYL